MGVAPQLGDYVLVSLLQPLRAGEQFRKWPLHVTILPWFRTHLDPHELQALLQEHTRGVDAFTAMMGATAQFGYHDQVPVRVVNEPNDFRKLHNHLFEALSHDERILFLDTSHCGPHFKAHITLHHAEPLREGDLITCNELQLVRLADIHPGGASKEVVREVELRDPSTA